MVLTDNYLRPEVQACNAQALAAGQPWFLVRPTGRQVWNRTASSVRGRPVAGNVWRSRPSAPTRRSAVTSTDGTAVPRSPKTARRRRPHFRFPRPGGQRRCPAAWIVRGEAPELEGKLQTYDVALVATADSCPGPFGPTGTACGRPGEETVFRPPTLQSRTKTFTADGGHRVATPEETLARFEHHVSPITGAVPMLERASPAASDGVMYVYLAGNNMARSPAISPGCVTTCAICPGKGVSAMQARAPAVCVKASSVTPACSRGDEPRIFPRKSR